MNCFIEIHNSPLIRKGRVAGLTTESETTGSIPTNFTWSPDLAKAIEKEMGRDLRKKSLQMMHNGHLVSGNK
jgi:hypothetical protein